MNIVAGIDPGIAGGIAFYDGDSWAEVFDMPVMRASRGKAAMDVDAALLPKLIGDCRPHVFIESVQSRPRQGGQFAFGMNFGKVLGALEVMGVEVTLVSSSKWKQKLGLRGEDKLMSVKLAEQLFPQLKSQLYGPRGAGLDGRAEALLIAYYGAHHAN